MQRDMQKVLDMWGHGRQAMHVILIILPLLPVLKGYFRKQEK